MTKIIEARATKEGYLLCPDGLHRRILGGQTVRVHENVKASWLVVDTPDGPRTLRELNAPSDDAAPRRGPGRPPKDHSGQPA